MDLHHRTASMQEKSTHTKLFISTIFQTNYFFNCTFTCWYGQIMGKRGNM